MAAGLVLGAVAHHQHTMIQLLATILIIKHTTHVQLEGSLVGLNGDADWLPASSLLECHLVKGRHILIAIDGDHTAVPLLFLAGPVLSCRHTGTPLGSVTCSAQLMQAKQAHNNICMSVDD